MKEDGETDVSLYKDRLAMIDFKQDSALFNAEDVNFVGNKGTPSARNKEVFAATEALARALRLPRR